MTAKKAPELTPDQVVDGLVTGYVRRARTILEAANKSADPIAVVLLAETIRREKVHVRIVQALSTLTAWVLVNIEAIKKKAHP